MFKSNRDSGRKDIFNGYNFSAFFVHPTVFVNI